MSRTREHDGTRPPLADVALCDPDEPVGAKEIGARLGVAEQTVRQWGQRGLLPEPTWPEVGGRPAWKWQVIQRWAIGTGRMDKTAVRRPDPMRPALDRDGYDGIRSRLGDLPKWLLVMTEPDLRTGCLVYQGKTDRDGYGRTGGGRLLHRQMYELLVGPIPDEMTLDHLRDRGCRTSACWAPWHLEPVTEAENLRRKRKAATAAASTGRERPERAKRTGHAPQTTGELQ